MSDAVSYLSEPLTVGKVLVHTTIGDFDLELFSEQTPKACRNFIQHCLDGYYNGNQFHRVIKGFMAQTGDPTNTGSGGVTAFPELYGGGVDGGFEDEFHSRLRFNRRGLIGMASNGKGTNRSQWFITLGPCEFLNKRHTLFGKLTGTTLFNIMRFEELEIENASSSKTTLTTTNTLDEDMSQGKDRPFNPPRILSTEVLMNPFDDLKPRAKSLPTDEKKKDDAKSKKKPKKKNLTLLSFGDEEATEESALASTQLTSGGSTHDLLEDAKLSKQTMREEKETQRDGQTKSSSVEDIESTRQNVRDVLARKRAHPSANGGDGDGGDEDGSSRFRERKSSSGSRADEGDIDAMDDAAYDAHMRSKLLRGKDNSTSTRIPDQPTGATPSASQKDEDEKDPAKMRQKLTREYDQLKAEMGLSSNKGPSSIRTQAIRPNIAPSLDASLLSPLEQLRSKFKTRKENTALQNRESETLKKLGLFQAKLGTSNALDTKAKSIETVPKESKVDIPPVPLIEDEDDPTDSSGVGTDWMARQIRFQKRPQDYDPKSMARDVENMDYAVVDPRGEHGSTVLATSFKHGSSSSSSSSRYHTKHHSSSSASSRHYGGMSGVGVPTARDYESHTSKAPQQLEAEEENERIVQRLLEEEDRRAASSSSSSRHRHHSRSPSRSRSRSRSRSPRDRHHHERRR